MAVEMNQKYENRKADKDGNHKVAVVVRLDDKAKTCILKSEDGKAYGPMTFATLAKSWKRLEEVVEDGKEKVAEPEVVEEEKLADGTTYQQAMEEIIADEKVAVEKAKKEKPKKEKPEKTPKAEKPKKEKKVKEKKESTPKMTSEEKMVLVNEIAGIIEETGNLAKIFEKKCMTSITKNKRSMAEFYVRNGKVAIWCKKEVSDNFADKYNVTHHPSCGMKYQFDVPDMDAVKDVINFIKEV